MGRPFQVPDGESVADDALFAVGRGGLHELVFLLSLSLANLGELRGHGSLFLPGEDDGNAQRMQMGFVAKLGEWVHCSNRSIGELMRGTSS